MRISSFAILLSVAAGSGLTQSDLAQSDLIGDAVAVQDQSHTIGGVETVCTGAGSAKDNPAWDDYPVKLALAPPGGRASAQEHVAVTEDGRPVAETDCEGPWVLMKLPAGEYSVAASIGARTAHAAFSTGGRGKIVTVILPAAAERTASVQ